MKTSISRIMIRFFSLMLCLLLFSNISIGAQDLQALDEQAKERAANATEINNGDLYDYVEKLLPGSILSDYHDGSVSIDFTDTKLASESVGNFFGYSMRILTKSGFEKSFDSITFSYIDDKVFASLIISDYKNISDFKSTYFGFCVGEDKTSYVALQLLYDQAFKNFDHQTKMQEGFNEIFEEYNQQGKDIKYTSCNQLWFMASFDPGTAVSFKENKAIINYKTGMSDTVECGEKAWDEVNDCVENYNLLHNKYSEYLDFNRIDIVVFEDGTDNRLWDFAVQYSEGKWNTLISNYYTPNFEAGVKGIDVSETQSQTEADDNSNTQQSQTEETDMGETNEPLNYTVSEEAQKYVTETFTWQDNYNKYVGWKVCNTTDKVITLQIDVSFKNEEGQVIDTWVDQWQDLFPDSEGVMYAFTQKEYSSVEFKAASWDAMCSRPLGDLLSVECVDDVYTFTNTSEETMVFPSVSIIYKKGDNWVYFSENQIYNNGIELPSHESVSRNVYCPVDYDSTEVFIDGGFY